MAESGRYDLIVEDQLAFPNLSESVPLVGAPAVWALGGRGAGQAVAILDTGVDRDHPMLKGRVVADACFSTSSAALGASSVCPNGETSLIAEGAAQPCSATGCEHGTHVAGIAAGDSARLKGAAPDAAIVPVQVFSLFTDRPGGPQPCRNGGRASPCIASFTSDQIRGLDYVLSVAAAQKVAAANMSLGGGLSSEACDGELTKIVIDQLREARVATVVAAGNDGAAEQVSRPGCVSTAFTVGATSKQDFIAGFSNRGALVDVYAPGVAISSALPGGRTGALSGTSMAAPHVAGAFAALRSARPDASLSDLELALAQTGVAISNGRKRLAMKAAYDQLVAEPKTEESVMTSSTPGPIAAFVSSLAQEPAGAPMRVIVRVPDGRTEAAAAAARAAGCRPVQVMARQNLVVVEGTPAQIRELAQTGVALSIQRDVTSTTQK